MQVKCPHCAKDIDLVGARELKDEYGLGPNTVQHARERGKFPDPYLSFGNRNIWLRDSVQSYVEDRSKAKVESTVTDLLKALETLPEGSRKEARALLEKSLKT